MITNYFKTSWRSSIRHHAASFNPPRLKKGKQSLGGVFALLLMLMLVPIKTIAQSSANYTFATNATGSLALDQNGNSVDMTTGTTQLIAPGLDATASSVTSIGFDFYLMGTKFTQFSVQDDGLMQLGATAVPTNTYTISGGSATAPRLAAFNADFRTGTVSGKVHYKLVGTSPNRMLVVEFANMQVYYATADTGTSTWQMRLYENGNIEYVYGTMNVTSVATGNRAPSIGFYVGSATGKFASVLYATHTNSTTAPYAANPNATAVGAVAGLDSATNGSRRVYSFSPPSVAPANPTALTFTGVTALSSTLNWVDNSTNESAFLVTRATDAAFTANVVTTTVASTTSVATGGAYTSTQTGLSASTLYYYKIFAIHEGPVQLSGITDSKMTLAPGTFVSVASGNWNAGTTWDAGFAPTSVDSAIISAGHIVSVNATALSVVNLEVNGTLAYTATPTTFAVNGNLTVNASGAVNVFSTTVGKSLAVSGNIVNNGLIDLSVGSTTEGQLLLNGTALQTIGGSGTFNNSIIRNLIFNNTSTAVPNIIWQFNNVKIANNLDLTGAKINLSTNKITLGNNATAGTFTAPSGTGFMNGKFSRYWGATTTGTTISAGSDPTGTASRYPFLSQTGANRQVYITRTNATGAVAGEIAVIYNDATTTTNGLNIIDGSYTVNQRYNANWVVSNEGTAVSSSSYTVALIAENAFLAFNGNARIVGATAAIGGGHQNGTVTPAAQRITIPQSDLFAGPLYIGSASSDIPVTSVASGNWNAPATWSTGVVPGCNDTAIISAGHTVTSDSAGNSSKGIIIASGATLIQSAGDLTVGCTLKNNTFANNGTFTMSGGTLNVNGNMVHNAGSTFNQSAGDINIDGNDAGAVASSVASGTHMLNVVANAVVNLNLTGGNITIVDPPQSASTTTYAVRISQGGAFNNATGNHTFKFGNGVSNDASTTGSNGFYIYTYLGVYNYGLGNVIVDAGTTGVNRFVKSNGTIPIKKDLTITSGEYKLESTHHIAGNVVNNGILTTTSTLTMGDYSGSSIVNALPQSISGTGVFRNLATSETANLASFTINNSSAAGVSLNVPLSVSGTLTLTAGKVNTTATNILTLGTATLAGSLSGGGVNSYINGPFARTFATRTATGTYTVATLFPVGKATSYLPIYIDPTTTGVVVMTGEAFNSNSGTLGGGVVTLGTNRWEALIKSGNTNFTNSFIRVVDAATVATNKILQAPTANGAYASMLPATTFVSGTPNTLTTATAIVAANYTGYFSYGDLNICPAPTDQATSFMAGNLGATAFSGSFTAATSAPSHYLVVRYAAGATPTAPVNYTTYVAGGTLGAGTIAAVITAPATTFTQTGLTAGTAYDYYIYSYNNVSCYGPAFNLASPLVSSVTTCATATVVPTALTSSAINSAGFTIGWTAATTSTLALDIATNSTFTAFLPGYNAKTLAAGTVSEVVTGLTANTPYYIRLRAIDGTCFSVNSSTLTVTTECLSVTAFTENFDTTVTPALPSCWVKVGSNGTANTQNSISSSSPNTLYLYSSTSTSRAVVRMAPVSNAGANTNRLRFKLRANFGVGETVEVGYLTNANDATSFVSLQSFVADALTYSEKIVAPGIAPGANQYLAFRTGTASLSVLVDDVVWEAIPAPVISSFASTVSCGSSTVLTITGTDLLGTTVTINGTPFTPTTISNTQIVIPVNATITGNIVVTNSAGTATSATPFTFTSSPALTLSASAATICNGSSSSLVTVTAGGADYDTFVWSPATGVTGTATTGYTFNASVSNVYTLTATQSAGSCSRTATFNLTVNPSPTALTIAPTSATICQGAIQALTATGGITVGSSVVGNATTLTAATSQPTAFCNRYDHYWSQMVFTAAELNAAGVQAGNINSIKFNITTIGDAPNVTDFKIYIGTTTASALTAFTTTGLTQVFSAATYSQVVGLNTITFNTPYQWNGTSNLIIDMRQTGIDSINNAETYYTATTGLNTVLYAVTSTAFTGADGFANSAPSPTTSVNRLNTTFDWSAPSTVTWSPLIDLFTDTAATIPYTGTATTTVYVKGSASTPASYVATASNALSCNASASVNVTVNTNAAPTAVSPQAALTLANIVISPSTGIKWYASQADALAGTPELPATTPAVNGVTYYATHTATCESLPTPVTIDMSLGSPSFDMNTLKYYPNPVTNVLTVSYGQEITELKLYNMVGQQLMVKTVNSTETQIDMSHLPAGSYLLEVSSGAKSKMVKLLKNQ